MTGVDVTGRAPLSHGEAMALQRTELNRTLAFLLSLAPDDWAAQTDCPDWDVRLMYLHVLGACEAGASLRHNAHQMRLALQHRRRHGGALEAALSSVQVAERMSLTPEQIIERLAAIAPTTVAKRSKLPGVMRRFKMKVDGPVVETWSLGYLTDTIYLRDLWMHRVDASRATGRAMHLTADHDGVIVTDVVTEWARRHGQPVSLALSGVAGGVYTAGRAQPDSVPSMTSDAIEFCRILAGRGGPASGLLATIVPF